MSTTATFLSCTFWSSDKEDVAAFSSHAPRGVDQAMAVATHFSEFALHWEVLTPNRTAGDAV